MIINFLSILQIQRSNVKDSHVETDANSEFTFLFKPKNCQSYTLLKFDSGKEKIRSPHQSKHQNMISSQRLPLISPSRWSWLWKHGQCSRSSKGWNISRRRRICRCSRCSISRRCSRCSISRRCSRCSKRSISHWWSRRETLRRNRWCTHTHRSCSNWPKIRGLHIRQITKELIFLLARQIHMLTSVWMDHHGHLSTFLFFLFLLKSFGFLFLIFHPLLFLVFLELPFQRFFWIDASLDSLIHRLDRFGQCIKRRLSSCFQVLTDDVE